MHYLTSIFLTFLIFLIGGNFTLTSYDTLGRRISATDAEGNLTQFAYDPQGRLIAVTDALGAVTRYAYDQRGLQIAQTDALNRVTTYEYDLMGRRTARILPQGQREEMTYNTLGQLTAHKDFNGQTIARTYDYTTSELLSIAAPQNHPSLTLSHAPARYDFTYDLLGRRTGSTAKNKLGTLLSSETYQYDLRSQLTGYAGTTGTIGYGYDSAGNLAGTKSNTTSGYDVSYDYDALNRITKVYRGQEGNDPSAIELAAYNYDANGNLNGTGYANGVQHAYTYNPQNRLTNLNVARSVGVSPTSLQSYAYQLNNNGHRTTRTTTGPVATIIPNQTQSFTINDRLTTDTYDANGNTLVSKEGGTGVPPVSSSSVTDVYSFDNRLIRRTTPDGKTIDLTYNPDGHRLSKFITQNALTQRLIHYLTDANNPTGYAQVIEEKDPLAASGQELKKVHLYGHDLISSETRNASVPPTSSSPIYYSYDGLGSVRSITDESGDLQETYDYDAYGTLIGLNKRNPTTGLLESADLTNPTNKPTSEFLYTGEQWDADLGMYFLRVRYLNTNTGRFHTQDTYEGQNGEPVTLHKYLYANANPASYVDPSGNMSLIELSVVQSENERIDQSSRQSTINLYRKSVSERRWQIFVVVMPNGMKYFEHTFIWANDTRSSSAFGYHVIAHKYSMLASERLGIFVPGLFVVVPQKSPNAFGPVSSLMLSGFLTKTQFLIWNAINIPLGAGFALSGATAFQINYRIPDASCKTWLYAAAASAATISLLPF